MAGKKWQPKKACIIILESGREVFKKVSADVFNIAPVKTRGIVAATCIHLGHGIIKHFQKTTEKSTWKQRWKRDLKRHSNPSKLLCTSYMVRHVFEYMLFDKRGTMQQAVINKHSNMVQL